MALLKVLKGIAANLPTDKHDGYVYFTTDDAKLYIDSYDAKTKTTKRTLVNPSAVTWVQSDTTDGWNKKAGLVSSPNIIYIYTDHIKKGNITIPGIKVGDGNAFIVDLPFIDTLYLDHINDADIHITSTERKKWNTAMKCALPNSDS